MSRHRPARALAGFVFPREAMPAPAAALGLLLPLTYYLRVLRGVLLKGAGLHALWPEGLAPAAFAAALVLVSVWRFTKTLQ